MARLVTSTTMFRRTTLGILGADLNHMLVNVTGVRMVQMSVMEIVDMIEVANGDVAASRPMHVRVVGVSGVVRAGHTFIPLSMICGSIDRFRLTPKSPRHFYRASRRRMLVPFPAIPFAAPWQRQYSDRLRILSRSSQLELLRSRAGAPAV
jgi:hypothetical protein